MHLRCDLVTVNHNYEKYNPEKNDQSEAKYQKIIFQIIQPVKN